jgi:peptidoglycan/xylan/chitin deacetylase (PgdA/CDA1 family)
MTRRAWIAIAVALVVNLTVVSIALALDARGGPGASATASVGDARVSRPHAAASVRETTTTTVPPDPIALPPAPARTPVTLPTSSTGAPLISRVPTTDRVVFVTIDDGVVQDPAVVDMVRRMKIPVTMFLVRDFARQGQAYFQQLVDLGGLVEAHTIKHSNLTTLSPSGQQTEICGPLNDLQSLFGRRPLLFRPPGGAYNTTTRSIAASCGFRYVVNWTAAANDGRIDWQAGKMEAGDIVLFHFRTDLVQNLKLLAYECRLQGFTVARLEDYLLPS